MPSGADSTVILGCAPRNVTVNAVETRTEHTKHRCEGVSLFTLLYIHKLSRVLFRCPTEHNGALLTKQRPERRFQNKTPFCLKSVNHDD